MSLFPLKNFTPESVKHILKVQSEMKIKKGVAQYSIALTIEKIVKEHKELTENNKHNEK